MEHKQQEMIPHDYVWHAPQWYPLVATLSKTSVDAYNRYTKDFNDSNDNSIKDFILDQRHRYLNLCFDEMAVAFDKYKEHKQTKFTHLLRDHEFAEGKLVCIGKEAKDVTLSDLISEKKHYAENLEKVWNDPKSSVKALTLATVLNENFSSYIEGLPDQVKSDFAKWERDIKQLKYGGDEEKPKLFHELPPSEQAKKLEARGTLIPLVQATESAKPIEKKKQQFAMS